MASSAAVRDRQRNLSSKRTQGTEHGVLLPHNSVFHPRRFFLTPAFIICKTSPSKQPLWSASSIPLTLHPVRNRAKFKGEEHANLIVWFLTIQTRHATNNSYLVLKLFELPNTPRPMCLHYLSNNESCRSEISSLDGGKHNKQSVKFWWKDVCKICYSDQVTGLLYTTWYSGVSLLWSQVSC